MRTRMYVFLVMAVMATANVKAQNPYFPVKEGLVQIYAQKDAKGKVQSYSKQTIKDVEGTGNEMTVSYTTEVLDKKRKSTNPPVELSYQVQIKDGVLRLDLKSMLGNIGQGGEAAGVAVEIPSDLKPGQKLKDSEVKMQIGFIKASAAMTEGECVAIEEISVEAGTFACAKVSQMVNSSAMGIKTAGKQITWYAPGVGAVRTETYNKDKLQSVIELVEMN
ncbi:hypothetical protein AGMMS49574_02000 [Bacteroidia bacterium]|nr:hypothetical protein AGMMS49574_02000 [Bacteroidia bacterium]